jgi:tetratricopeptide (TPR) repeat protein
MKKEPQKANGYYQKVLDINKNFAPAANNLAYNYAQHGGNLDIALGLAQRAREANSNDASTADTLGWIYYKKGVYETALALLKESDENFKGQNPTVLYHLARVYEKTGDARLAREAARKALGLGRNFSDDVEARKLLEKLG